MRRRVSLKTEHTRMISKSISWSTCMNFWSHSSISVVLRRLSSSSLALGGSFLWCSHHSMTFLRTASLTWTKRCKCLVLGAGYLGVDTHVGDGNSLSGVAKVLEHVLDQDGALSSGALCSESVSATRDSILSGGYAYQQRYQLHRSW